MSEFRALPSRPNLEFERKRAKQRLREMRADDPAVLLADAQHTIAREYGFSSWPRLVRYFTDAAKPSSKFGLTKSPELLQQHVQSLLDAQRAGKMRAARELAAYVPRFYGSKASDILSAEITEDDARLAVARGFGYPSWDELMVQSVADAQRRDGGWNREVWERVRDAITNADVGALSQLAEANPEILAVRDDGRGRMNSLVGMALGIERRLASEESEVREIREVRKRLHPVMQWLVDRGFDIRGALSQQLCGHIRMNVDDVRYLLERGADPSWIAPNGISVLEHALMLYWNGEAVDLVAARAKPQLAFWIAAGLDDLPGMKRFLDDHGRPTKAARTHRPQFALVGLPMAQHPEPDDDEILLEAFFVAMLNGRKNAMEHLIRLGTRITSTLFGGSLIDFAAGNEMTTAIEVLTAHGAVPSP